MCKGDDMVFLTRRVHGSDKCKNFSWKSRVASVKSKCDLEDIIKMVCREAVQNIEKEHTGMHKGMFWKCNQFT